MKKHCNKMVMCGFMMAFLLIVTGAHPISENLQHSRRLLDRTDTITAPTTTLSYYMLALQWPPSTCASGFTCMGSVPPMFTIHGLWPQNGTGKGLPPYEVDQNCTTLKPVPPNQIYGILQKGNMVGELTRVWPSLNNTQSAQENQKFWEYQWAKHGMCSEYADTPYDYFYSAVNLRNYIAQVVDFVSGKTYKVQEVVDEVKQVLNGTPEVACRNKKGGKGAKIVSEIRICIKKGKVNPGGIQDCKRPISGVCKSMTDEVSFV